MTENQQKNRLLRMARIIQTMYLVSTGILFSVVLLLPKLGDQLQLYDTSQVNTLTPIFGFMALFGIVMGFIIPDRVIYKMKSDTTLNQRFIASTVLRCALFETPAIYGIALSFIGASQPVALGFIIVSAVFLLYTFPTEDKISHFLNKIPK